jgi:hypothetical protein
MTYSHAPIVQVTAPIYWCPTCRCPVATAQVRKVHTGRSGETVHNHRNHVVRDGVARQVDHTVIHRQTGAIR